MAAARSAVSGQLASHAGGPLLRVCVPGARRRRQRRRAAQPRVLLAGVAEREQLRLGPCRADERPRDWQDRDIQVLESSCRSERWRRQSEADVVSRPADFSISCLAWGRSDGQRLGRRRKSSPRDLRGMPAGDADRRLVGDQGASSLARSPLSMPVQRRDLWRQLHELLVRQ